MDKKDQLEKETAFYVARPTAPVRSPIPSSDRNTSPASLRVAASLTARGRARKPPLAHPAGATLPSTSDVRGGGNGGSELLGVCDIWRRFGASRRFSGGQRSVAAAPHTDPSHASERTLRMRAGLPHASSGDAPRAGVIADSEGMRRCTNGADICATTLAPQHPRRCGTELTPNP